MLFLLYRPVALPYDPPIGRNNYGIVQNPYKNLILQRHLHAKGKVKQAVFSRYFLYTPST